MPNWIIKSAIHRLVSWLPNPQAWNYLLQRYITKSLSIGPGSFEFKVQRAARMMDDYFSCSTDSLPSFTVLELGTGWYPVISVAHYLCGAERISTIDIDPLLRPAHVKRVLQLFSDYAERGMLTALLPRAQPSRIAELRTRLNRDGLSATEMLARLNIKTLVLDACQTGLPTGSADLIFSESVINQVPPEVLSGIFREFRRLASTKAVMVHSLQLSDYYARFDRRITEFNMFRYSPGAWRWLNSPVEPQNRMRLADYRELHRISGFKLVSEQNTSGARENLERTPLHNDFKKYSPNDLLTTFAWLVSVPAAIRNDD